MEPGRLAGSGFPFGRRPLRWLKGEGVTSVLTLTEEAPDLAEIERLGLRWKQVPMVNKQPETPETLEKAVDFVRAELSSGRRVLVHCLAGQGRTGMVLAAYLVSSRGLSPEEAVGAVRMVRPLSLTRGRQREAVGAYAEYLKRTPTRRAPSPS